MTTHEWHKLGSKANCGPYPAKFSAHQETSSMRKDDETYLELSFCIPHNDSYMVKAELLSDSDDGIIFNLSDAYFGRQEKI